MNALMKMVRPPSATETARQALSEAEHKLQRCKERLATHEEARKRYAVDAQLGVADAQKALDRVNAELAQDRIERDSLAAGLEGLRENLQQAEAAEADQSRAKDVKELKRLLTQCIDIGNEWDGWCQEAMRIVNRRETAGDQIERIMCRLEGREFKPGLAGPMGHVNSVHGRMAQVATMAGLGRVLDFFSPDNDPKFARRPLAEREAILKLQYLKGIAGE
jgi:hypothetical protein